MYEAARSAKASNDAIKIANDAKEIEEEKNPTNQIKPPEYKPNNNNNN